LFVSGLAQGVAPGSEYYLIEVLDSKARGDVYTLIRAIALYLNTQPELPEMKTVFNMSLGIQAERVGLGQGATPAIDALRNNLKNNYATFDDYSFLAELSNRFPAIALKAAVASAEQAGVVVVAAAGNDRGANPNAQEQAPANYSEVVGVAASNSGGKAACFSNPGDLAAPGGDGQVSSTCLEETPNFCDSSAADCPQGVVSLVTLRKDTSGYAYWMGTSFSTPMVSGLAALVWEAAPTRSSTDVRDVLECGVTPVSPGSSPILGLGIINVGESLFHCP
jgi:subtilisin family serine protease